MTTDMTNEQLKIETGVLLPEKVRRLEYQYPFMRMKVGDSFLVPIARQGSVRTAACNFAGKYPEYRFTCRRVRENGVIGYRIWRITK